MPHSPNDPPPDDRSPGADLSRHMDNGFNRVTAKLEGFQRMQRLMIQVGGGIVVTLLAASRFLG